jgi:hypothetical protein
MRTLQTVTPLAVLQDNNMTRQKNAAYAAFFIA